MNILITGGAGFIGSALVRYLMENTSHNVLNVDKLTYAGNLASLASVEVNPRYYFACVDVCDAEQMEALFKSFAPNMVMHLAAESHVDNSITNSAEFIKTNILGTHTLLEVARHYWLANKKEFVKFHHVSTDEVYGDLTPQDPAFTENTPYAPSSPYSASKASSDHLVRAWGRTYGLPVVLSNCSNNYGSHQFPEKLIPRVILNALGGQPLPIYGNGTQVRDWLFVEDHAAALYKIATEGKVGETYNVGGNNEKQNIDVVSAICTLLEELAPTHKPKSLKNYTDLITYVKDRPGHDQRYAVNTNKITTELGWQPKFNFSEGLRQTVAWYLANKPWWTSIQDGSYQDINRQKQEKTCVTKKRMV